MNHCLLEVEVQTSPVVRYTQDNKTPIAEMEVCFAGLRPDDQPNKLKVVGWGNIAQELQQKISIGEKLIVEGRLRMNTVPRNDGTKEKVAELTLAKMHRLSELSNNKNINDLQSGAGLGSNREGSINGSLINNSQDQDSQNNQEQSTQTNWNSAPLIPDTDEIPF
tara:strand:- start:428 stop:922 length:495 start_codon:yes stop_codon:yes gene_type:complete